MFQVTIEDALDHGFVVGEYETLEEAKVSYDECLKIGPEGYELSVELEEIIGDHDDYVSIEFTEWFTQEEWEKAPPWNEKEGVLANRAGCGSWRSGTRFPTNHPSPAILYSYQTKETK